MADPMSGLIKCYRCEAVYRPGAALSYGYFEPGTTNVFRPRGSIPAEHCPICRKPPLTEKPVEYVEAM